MLQTPYISDQGIDLTFGKILLKAGHFLTTTVADGIEQALVGHIILPLGDGQVTSVREPAARSFSASVSAVTLRAF